MHLNLVDASLVTIAIVNSAFYSYVARLLWRRNTAAQERITQATGAINTALLHATNLQIEREKQLVEFIVDEQKRLTQTIDFLQLAYTNDSKILADRLSAIHELYNATNQAVANTLKPVIDWCYIAENYVREFRAMKLKYPAGAKEGGDICGHCGKRVQQYFIDGLGRTTCALCKPEGFRDAVDRGIARL